MKILLAVDGSASSDQAIEEIVRRPWPEQTEVKVITAFEIPFTTGVEPWAAGPIYFDNLLKTASSAANGVLEDTLTKLKAAPDTGFKITGAVSHCVTDQFG